MSKPLLSGPEPEAPPVRPLLSADLPRFMVLEREVELEYRPRMLAALQDKVDAGAAACADSPPDCPQCSQPMARHDSRKVSWLARYGRLRALVARYRCATCKCGRRPLLDQLGVEPGRVGGSLARLLALLAAMAPHPLAARLAWSLLGVRISPMGIWRIAQRLGAAAADYSGGLCSHHADSRSTGAPTQAAPPVVALCVDGCALGMQVRSTRRRRRDGQALPALPPVQEGRFREVKTGVVLSPGDRVETAPGRHSLVRRLLVTCLGGADTVFALLYAELREKGWLAANTIVVVVGDGAEWIWNRAAMFVHRCEILDFWHALEHAWTFARLRYGDGPAKSAGWVHQIAADLKGGRVLEVIAGLGRMRVKTPELRESLHSLIRYYSANAGRMRYDEYLRLGYGIGSGAVESAHKQVVHSRFRQAGMRWSEPGARRLLALRVLLLNDNWALLDRLRMLPVA